MYICFKRGAISAFSSRPLKLVDESTYLGSNISSTESNVHIRLAKMWTAIDRLSIIWKSDLFDEIKREFLPSCVYVSTTVRMYHIDASKSNEEKTGWELHQNTTSYFEQILEAVPHGTTTVQSPNPHQMDRPGRTSRRCRTWLVGDRDGLISDVLQWTPIYR